MYKNKRQIGFEYEDIAEKYLVEKGHIILERNFRIGRDTEIDIISKDKDFIVFVEVKYRNSSMSGHPLESVNLTKQRKICSAAKRYIYKNKLSEYNKYRFDVIGILGDKIWHIEDAFFYTGR